MFDLSRFTDSIVQMIGQSGQAGELAEGLRSATGLDLSQLDLSQLDLGQLSGLGVDDALALLGQNGIDLAGLAPDQLTDLLGQVGAEGPLGELIGQVLASKLGS